MPPGSYYKTCTLLSMNSAQGVMTTQCDCKADMCEVRTDDFPYADCATPIENHDGSLYCVWDLAKVEARAKKKSDAAKAKSAADKAQTDLLNHDIHHELVKEWMHKNAADLEAAEPAMAAASVIVLGQEIGNQDAAFFAQQASAVDPAVKAKIAARDFQFTDAVAFLKKYVGTKDGEHWRNSMIDNAYLQVFGRKSTPTEQVTYYNRITAGKAWYATIVTDQLKFIEAGSPSRDDLATRVTKTVYGRPANLAELAASRKISTPYGNMVEIGRSALWSDNNVDELVATVTRAITKNGRPANDDAVKAAIEAYRPGHAIFKEMTSPVGKVKWKF